MKSTLPLLSFCAAAAIRCGAQPIIFDGESTMWWEGSADGGATWHRGVFEVSPGTSSIAVRSWLQFPHPTGVAGGFGYTQLDGVVTGAGAGDSVTNPDTGMPGFLLLNSFRFGNRIKIDDPRDTSPPGVGPYWVNCVQGRSQIGRDLRNPITLLNYTLNLDGTSGDRVVDCVFRQVATYPVGRVASIDMGILSTDPVLVTTVNQQTLTIRVLPAPGSLVALACVCAIPRRSRVPWIGPSADPRS